MTKFEVKKKIQDLQRLYTRLQLEENSERIRSHSLTKTTANISATKKLTTDSYASSDFKPPKAIKVGLYFSLIFCLGSS